MAEETIMQENVEMEENNEIALGPIVLGLAALGAAVFGGFKLFKHIGNTANNTEAQDGGARIEIVADENPAEETAEDNVE